MSVAEKEKLPDARLFKLVGFDPIITVGGVVSTDHVKLETVDVFAAVSVARTLKVWLPSVSAEKLNGLAHEAYAAPSILQVYPSTDAPPVSAAAKVKLPVLTAAGFSGEV